MGGRVDSKPQEVIVTGKLIIIALGAVVLMANAASAQQRPNGQSQVRHLPRVFGQTYGYVPRPAQQDQSRQNRYQDIYQSDSLGRQSFPNPDRVFPAPEHE